MVRIERNPCSFLLVYAVAASIAAILLIMLMRATERFAWWYVRMIESAS